MGTTELGACEWFVWDLRRSNLLDRGQLDQVIGEFLGKNPGAEPPALAEYLVRQKILTQFQADRLLQGKTQGFVLGPFTLMDTLGAGSMGTVYKAQSKNDNQWYAVKVLPRRSMWNVRLARRKVRSFEQCRHPAVVPFVDVGTAGGMHYLAWPLVDGETLDKRVQREGKLSAGLAAYYAQQTAEGLSICHKQGLFHGLLKPSNLMLSGDQQVRILDFGIGSLLAETEGESLVDTMSTANSVASGLDCASPESIMDPSNLTPLGDQYSLGCVLYYCLSGQYPFPDGSAAEKMVAHQFKQPKALREVAPEVSANLVAVVERLMQKAPEARYGDIAEVQAALAPFVAGPVQPPEWAAKKPASRSALSLAAERLRASRTAGTSASERRPPSSPLLEEIAAVSRTTVPASEPANSRASPLRKSAANLSLPSRQSLREGSPAKAKPADRKAETPMRRHEPAPAAPVAEAEEKVVKTLPSRQNLEVEVKSTWDERLGPVGIAVGALIACGLAWLLTWRLF